MAIRVIAALIITGYPFCACGESSQRDITAILSGLQASDWTVRAAAVNALAEGHLRDATIRRALVHLLDQENHSLRDPARSIRSTQEAEAMGRYYGKLEDEVLSFVDPGDEASVSVLVQSVYNPDSPLALQLASYGQTVVPALMKINADPNPERRSDSYEVLGQVLRQHRLGKSRYPLTPESVRDIEQRVRSGLRDPLPFIRGSAIRGVKAAGDVASLPVLEELKTSDPYVLDGTKRFWIREQAVKAIAAIHATPLGQSSAAHK